MSAITLRSLRAAVVLAAAALAVVLAGSAASADAKLVAPLSACQGQKNVKAPERLQEHAMHCLINFARDHAGVGRVDSNGRLERAAGRKVGDVMDCGFSHTACGNPADLYPRRFGYTSAPSWQVGENLAWGRDGLGTPRKILKAWLNSPPHRETMLHGSFDHLGLGLRRGGFNGQNNVGVWVLELGCHGC
jgi:uncharacterized protein YkwD